MTLLREMIFKIFHSSCKSMTLQIMLANMFQRSMTDIKIYCHSIARLGNCFIIMIAKEKKILHKIFVLEDVDVCSAPK